jgi:uracil-DNA glycosylase
MESKSFNNIRYQVILENIQREVHMNRHDIPLILFDNTGMVQPYPADVSPVNRMLDITAFFPGGKGLWSEEYTDIIPNILVLGQDFSTLKDYEKMAKNESTDLGCPTWRNLIALFNEVGIDLKQCFFSNVFMGLRKTDSLVGKFPGSRDIDFVKRNLDFLLFQIDLIKPRMIVTLGRPASEMLSTITDQISYDWEKGKALKTPYNGLKKEVQIGSHTTLCIALEHTSMRNSNVKRRKYKNASGDFSGHQAEVEMLKDGLRLLIE